MAKKQVQTLYHKEYKLQCVTCGGRFTRIFDAPPRDEADARQRQDGIQRPRCPFCSRFRPE